MCYAHVPRTRALACCRYHSSPRTSSTCAGQVHKLRVHVPGVSEPLTHKTCVTPSNMPESSLFIMHDILQACCLALCPQAFCCDGRVAATRSRLGGLILLLDVDTRQQLRRRDGVPGA